MKSNVIESRIHELVIYIYTDKDIKSRSARDILGGRDPQLFFISNTFPYRKILFFEQPTAIFNFIEEHNMQASLTTFSVFCCVSFSHSLALCSFLLLKFNLRLVLFLLLYFVNLMFLSPFCYCRQRIWHIFEYRSWMNLSVHMIYMKMFMFTKKCVLRTGHECWKELNIWCVTCATLPIFLILNCVYIFSDKYKWRITVSILIFFNAVFLVFLTMSPGNYDSR